MPRRPRAAKKRASLSLSTPVARLRAAGKQTNGPDKSGPFSFGAGVRFNAAA